MQEMVKSFDEPDIRMETANGNGKCRRLEFGDVGVADVTMQPGFQWTKDIKTLPGAEQWVTGELCELRHVGLVLEGTFHYELAEGTSFDVGPGEAYDVPAGRPHDEWVVGDAVCRVIDVWPAVVGSNV